MRNVNLVKALHLWLHRADKHIVEKLLWQSEKTCDIEKSAIVGDSQRHPRVLSINQQGPIEQSFAIPYTTAEKLKKKEKTRKKINKRIIIFQMEADLKSSLFGVHCSKFKL